MKITTYDDDETVFAFSMEKKSAIITEDSPRKQSKATIISESLRKQPKSNAFEVPKYNSHMMDASRHELRNDDSILALINILIFSLTYIQHNIFFTNNYQSTEFVNYLRILILILSVSSILWMVRRYQIKLILMLIKYQISVRDTLFSTGLYKRMFLEILLTLLVMPPYFDSTFDVEMLGYRVTYSWSAVFTFISMMRLYVILRLFGHYSEYTQDKSEVICSKHAVTSNAYFALKCYLKESPFTGIAFSFFFMSCFSAVAMKLCEEPNRVTISSGAVNTSTLAMLWDDLWVIFYTTTTVGYGNLYPVTHFGRAVCILACILGNMYLGMMVVSINQKMELDEAQNLSYAWISRNHIAVDIKKHATAAVRKAATLYLLAKRWKTRTISKIKPNSVVNCKGVIVRNDLCELTESQYRTKLRIYRELKVHLDKVRDLNLKSREVGSNEIDLIYGFEDAVRIDFPKVVRRIKGVVNRKDIDASEFVVKACKPAEFKAEQIKEFCKNFRRKVSHAVRRKTIQVEGGEVNRGSRRHLTN